MSEYRQYTNEELSALLAESDYAAFTEIHERFYPLLYSHAYKKYPHREEVRDLLQELFAALWNNRHTTVFTSGIAVYLYSATRNRMINLFQKKKVRSVYLQSLQHFMDQGENITDWRLREKEMARQVEKEIAALPAQMRRVFELSRNEHLSNREIAELLNTSPLTVKKQVHNALKILRTRLDPTTFFFFF